MRKEFIKTLTEIAEKDKDVYLLTGDLGFSVFEEFAQKFPERFIDCGVSEQNMASLAAGMALEGKKPYIYSIIPFITFRCLEQIRNDICYQNLNVKIVGIGTGFSYGAENFTHYAIEDISILKPLPNITILSPADPIETKELFMQSYKKNGPTYIRLDKSSEIIHNIDTKILIGRPNILKNGSDGIIITTGSCLKTAINVANKLKKDGIDLKVASMHTLKPVDENYLIKEIGNLKMLFTIEEHSVVGGLGSIVNDILAKNNIHTINTKNIGVADNYKDITGSREFLRKYHKIDETEVYKIIKKLS